MGSLTDQEIKDLRLLIAGRREPQTDMERHFVQVMQRLVRPCSPKENEWFVYWRSVTQHAPDHFKVRAREKTIAALVQRIASLKQALESKDQSNSTLRQEITELKTFLHNCHAALNKYDPVRRPVRWENCHQCGGTGGLEGCPRCGGNGYEPAQDD